MINATNVTYIGIDGPKWSWKTEFSKRLAKLFDNSTGTSENKLDPYRPSVLRLKNTDFFKNKEISNEDFITHFLSFHTLNNAGENSFSIPDNVMKLLNKPWRSLKALKNLAITIYLAVGRAYFQKTINAEAQEKGYSVVFLDRDIRSNIVYQWVPDSEKWTWLSMEEIIEINSNFWVKSPELAVTLESSAENWLDRLKQRENESKKIPTVWLHWKMAINKDEKDKDGKMKKKIGEQIALYSEKLTQTINWTSTPIIVDNNGPTIEKLEKRIEAMVPAIQEIIREILKHNPKLGTKINKRLREWDNEAIKRNILSWIKEEEKSKAIWRWE